MTMTQSEIQVLADHVATSSRTTAKLEHVTNIQVDDPALTKCRDERLKINLTDAGRKGTEAVLLAKQAHEADPL